MSRQELIDTLRALKDKMDTPGYTRTPQAIAYVKEKETRKESANMTSIDTCNTLASKMAANAISNSPTDQKKIQYSPTYISATLYDKEVRVLVDTGASLSLINADLWDNISNRDKEDIPLFPWTRGDVKTAGEETLYT